MIVIESSDFGCINTLFFSLQTPLKNGMYVEVSSNFAICCDDEVWNKYIPEQQLLIKTMFSSYTKGWEHRSKYG